MSTIRPSPTRAHTGDVSTVKRTAASPASGADARTRILEFVKVQVAEHGAVPSLQQCDAAAGTNGYAKSVRPGILVELGIEESDRQDETS